MSELDGRLKEFSGETEVVISVQDDGRFQAVLYSNSSEVQACHGTSAVDALINLEAILDHG